MENKIYGMKEKLVSKIESEMQDMDRMDERKVGTLIDALHHLAETEYYCSIADAMWAEKHGYTPASAGLSATRSGYSGQAMHRYASSGYDDEVAKLGEKYRNATPDERMSMKSRVLSMFGSM